MGNALWPGVAGYETTEVKISWSDFHESRYETGHFWIANAPVEEYVKPVFNGHENTLLYPAVANGKKAYYKLTKFYPNFGHANYGYAGFVSIEAA